jgi:hypothetical protein
MTRPAHYVLRVRQSINGVRHMGEENFGKGPDKYDGMVGFDMELTPSVWICGGAGAVLGAILAWWGTSDVAIILATTVTFAVLSGIFGFFVPWYKPSDRK